MNTLTPTLETPSLQLQVATAFDSNKAAIAEVKKFAELTVAKHGIGKVTAGRVAVKKLRVAIDHRRKELNETALQTQRAVNAYAKELTAEIEPVEQYLQDQEDAHEAAKLKIEQEKQAARRAILTGRIERLAQAGAVASDVEALERMTDAEYLAHLASEVARVDAERIAAEKLEAEKQAEIARQAEELRIRQEELESDRKKMEAEREAMLHQQAIHQKQLEEQQAEVRRQQEEIRAEAERKAEAERQRVLAERQAENRRLAKIAADEAEASRLAELEALKPEIEKAATFTKLVSAYASDMLTGIGRPSWSDEAMREIESACNEIRRTVGKGAPF